MVLITLPQPFEEIARDGGGSHRVCVCGMRRRGKRSRDRAGQCVKRKVKR